MRIKNSMVISIIFKSCYFSQQCIGSLSAVWQYSFTRRITVLKEAHDMKKAYYRLGNVAWNSVNSLCDHVNVHCSYHEEWYSFIIEYTYNEYRFLKVNELNNEYSLQIILLRVRKTFLRYSGSQDTSQRNILRKQLNNRESIIRQFFCSNCSIQYVPNSQWKTTNCQWFFFLRSSQA
jgi:hypothetical protein